MKRRWAIFAGVAVFGALCGLLLLPTDSAERKALEKTRRELRQQGFKIDLSEFDFSVSPESRARATALTNAVLGNPQYGRPLPVSEPLASLRPVGSNAALVVWREDNLEDERDYIDIRRYSGENLWTMVRQKCDEDRNSLDAACMAALGGPIGFELNAKGGFSMMLGHLLALRSLSQMFAARAFLELRNQHNDAAWTNLLALTRLVTAYNPEPSEVSHVSRCSCAVIAYNATWQLLQAHCWTEGQLATLQREWESADFLKGWPETMALTRASTVDAYERERKDPVPLGLYPFKYLIRTPRTIWPTLVSYWQRVKYRHYGIYKDEAESMLFYRDSELHLKRAVQAATWIEMRKLPGVTNLECFVSKNPSATQCFLNSRALSFAWLGAGHRPLARAAETEARRRIIITALALERFRLRHGDYPESLKQLVPEFLEKEPADFIDGKPLRYQPTGVGQFVLYSVGLDSFDDGGRIPERTEQYSLAGAFDTFGFNSSKSSDLVWPRAASPSEAKWYQKKAVEKKRMEERRLEELAARFRADLEGQAEKSDLTPRILYNTLVRTNTALKFSNPFE